MFNGDPHRQGFALERSKEIVIHKIKGDDCQSEEGHKVAHQAQLKSWLNQDVFNFTVHEMSITKIEEIHQ